MIPETAEQALGLMWSICDKHERLQTLLRITNEPGFSLNSQTFWNNFWSVWTSSENINDDHEFIPQLLDRGVLLGSPLDGLDDDDRVALLAMPDRFKVYRGCVSLNREGYSWTTDYDRAVWFAERAYSPQPTDHYVLSGWVERDDVLGYLTGRGESEIVIDPKDVEEIEEAEIVEVENSSQNGLFYAIQSGRWRAGDDALDQARADMMAGTVRDGFDDLMQKIDRQLAFINWSGATSKKSYMEKLREAILKRKDAIADDKDVNEPFTFQM